MTGSDAQNGDICQTYWSVMTDPANVWIGAARRRLSQRKVGPETRKAMARSSTDGEIGLKKGSGIGRCGVSRAS